MGACGRGHRSDQGAASYAAVQYLGISRVSADDAIVDGNRAISLNLVSIEDERIGDSDFRNDAVREEVSMRQIVGKVLQ